MWETFIAILTLSMASGTAAEQNCTYYDVIKYLNFPSYNKHLLYTIPKKNWEDPLELKMDFSLVSILSVAEKLQTVTFYFLLTLRWKNALVTWKPQDFCGISKIILPEDTFWSPHIFIFEQVDKEKSSIIPYLSITHNGLVRTRQPHQVTITCSLKIHKFPFDAQTCNISIGTFMYTVRDIIINPGQTEEDLNSKSQLYFQTDGEWKPLTIKIREHKVIEQEEKFGVIVYEIFMQRQPLYYVVNLILPTCMLYLLDMALLFGPSSYGEKIGFQISLVLGISMLAVILNDILPTSSESLPVIVLFFGGAFVLMIIGTLETCLLMQLKERNPPLALVKVMRLLTCSRTDFPTAETSVALSSASSEPLGKEDTEVPMLAERTQPEQRTGNEATSREREWALLLLEKLFLYGHLLLSLLHLTYIVVKWNS